MIQDQARKLIVWRQRTIERRALAILTYGIANAMQQGLIPQTTNKTWNRWSFSRPSLLTCDSGYDNDAQIQSLTMGISSKDDICAKRGTNWKDVSNQSELELRDLFDRAKKIAADYNMTEAESREWLSKRDIDVIAPQPAKDEDIITPIKDEMTNEDTNK